MSAGNEGFEQQILDELAEAKAELADWHKYVAQLADSFIPGGSMQADTLHVMKTVAMLKNLRAKINNG